MVVGGATLEFSEGGGVGRTRLADAVARAIEAKANLGPLGRFEGSARRLAKPGTGAADGAGSISSAARALHHYPRYPDAGIGAANLPSYRRGWYVDQRPQSSKLLRRDSHSADTVHRPSGGVRAWIVAGRPLLSDASSRGMAFDEPSVFRTRCMWVFRRPCAGLDARRGPRVGSYSRAPSGDASYCSAFRCTGQCRVERVPGSDKPVRWTSSFFSAAKNDSAIALS